MLGRLAASLDGPPYNLVLHTAPLREQVDGTYHWHWEIHPRLREIAGLELGTGLPVNPVSPEDAVEELLGRAAGGRWTGVDARRATRRASHEGGRLVFGPRARDPRRLLPDLVRSEPSWSSRPISTSRPLGRAVAAAAGPRR